MGNAAVWRHKKKEAAKAKEKDKAAAPKPPSRSAPSPQTMSGLHNPNQRVPTIRIDMLADPYGGKLEVRVLADGFIAMDKQKALEYINLPVFPGEREVDEAQVQYLFDCMRQGTFNWSNTQLATILYNGVTYKGNGQHTAWAVDFMEHVVKNFKSPPQVRETAYAVRSEEEMRRLYATFDRNKARTDGHINKVLLVNKAVTDGIWNNSINKLVSGLKLWHWPGDTARRRLLPDHIAAYVEHECAPLFRAVGLFLQQKCKDNSSLWRQGVIAAMFATFDKTAQKAPEFWEPVSSGLCLTAKSDPRYKLREWLTKVIVGGASPARKTERKESVNPEAVMTTCMGQWNRWRKGESTQNVHILAERPRLL